MCNKLLNNIIFEKLVKLLCLNCSDLLRSDWVLIHRKYENKFSNIIAVIDLIFTLSPSSAEAERVFSQLKCLKTNLRSRLNQTTLKHAFSIKLHSKTIVNYDPNPAIHYWNNRSIRQRRPLFERKKSKETEELEENSDVVTAVNHLEENNATEEENHDQLKKNPSMLVVIKRKPVTQLEMKMKSLIQRMI